MAHMSASGGMLYNPYAHVRTLGPYNWRNPAAQPTYLSYGKWLHNPHQSIPRAIGGAGLAYSVGAGNFLTRNFRQKPIVGLQTATHTKINKPSKPVENKILSTSTNKMVKVSHPRRTKRPFKGRRRRHRKLPPLSVPRSKIVRFRTVVPFAWTSSAGAIATSMCKANSLNDPTAGFGTGLPLGLDQWAAQYQKYIVLGSKIKVRCIPTTNTGAGVIGIYLADNNTALTSASHYKELPNNRQKIVTTQKDYTVVTHSYSGRRFWRLTNIKDDSEQEAAFSTTPGDPTDIAYYQVYIQDLIGANNFNADVQVEIEFICLLTDPVTLAQSSL